MRLGVFMGTNQSLWDFACGLYAYQDVRQQCLELQDVYQANVNLILWLCWLHASEIHVHRDALCEARTIADGSSRELLLTLRDARAQLIACSNFTRVQQQLIRKHILSAELAIEKVMLQRLQDLTARIPRVSVIHEELTVFDYLDSLGLEAAGEQAAFLLEQARIYQVSLGLEMEILGE